MCVCVCVCAQLLSRVRLFGTPWTVAHQAPLSVGFSRQAYWSGLPFPPPGDLLDPGIKPVSPESTCIGRRILYHCATWEAGVCVSVCVCVCVCVCVRAYLFCYSLPLRYLRNLGSVCACVCVCVCISFLLFSSITVSQDIGCSSLYCTAGACFLIHSINIHSGSHLLIPNSPYPSLRHTPRPW